MYRLWASTEVNVLVCLRDQETALSSWEHSSHRMWHFTLSEEFQKTSWLLQTKSSLIFIECWNETLEVSWHSFQSMQGQTTWNKEQKLGRKVFYIVHVGDHTLEVFLNSIFPRMWSIFPSEVKEGTVNCATKVPKLRSLRGAKSDPTCTCVMGRTYQRISWENWRQGRPLLKMLFSTTTTKTWPDV